MCDWLVAWRLVTRIAQPDRWLMGNGIPFRPRCGASQALRASPEPLDCRMLHRRLKECSDSLFIGAVRTSVSDCHKAPSLKCERVQKEGAHNRELVLRGASGNPAHSTEQSCGSQI